MTPQSKTLLVTGGAGFIGSCFIAQAVEKGFQVIVLDALTYAGHLSNLEWIRPSATGGNWTLVHGDINNRALVFELLHKHHISWLVNFAAESHVDNSIASPSAFIETNITGGFHLLEASREHWNGLPQYEQEQFRFLQVSTDEVYGSLGVTGSFSENSPYQPNSPYAASKASGDHLVRAWHETYGLPTITTHCTNNYGPRQHPEKLIPNMIRCALSGKKLPVYGDGKNIRDWIHVEDHCAGLWLALEKGIPGQCYNFGGSEEVENLTLVNSICNLLDSKLPLASGSYLRQIDFVTDRPGHDRRYAINSIKAQQELGFTRRHRLAGGIDSTIDWYLSHQEWCNLRMGSR